MRKPVFGGLRLGKTNRPAQPWVLMFRTYQLQVSYYLSSENKGADQTAQMRRLICTFVVRIWHKKGFVMMRPNSANTNKTGSAQYE